jgi:YD repeat-containing protein
MPRLIMTRDKTDADATWSNYYDATGSVIKRTFYDGLGRPIQEQIHADDWTNVGGVSGHEIVQYTLYDALGQVREASMPYEVDAYYNPSVGPYRTPDPGQPSTDTAYDALGRVTEVSNPDGTHTLMGYKGWKTAVVDAKGHQRMQEADAFGRMVKVQEYSGTYAQPSWSATPYAITQYAYDELDNLTTVTDAASNITTMAYDALGRKQTMNDPDMGAWDYAYNPAGNLRVQDDAKHQRICLYYDVLDRLKGKYYTNDTTS